MQAAFDFLLGSAPQVVLVALAIFARIGAAAFFVPGMGETAVPMRLRLGVALALTWLILPIVLPLAPDVPRAPAALALLLVAEAGTGLLIGLAFRLVVFVLQVAGAVAAQNVTISHMFGGGVAPEPEPTIATLLAMGGVVLAMMMGLHVKLVAALAALYGVLPFGAGISGSAAAEWSTARVGEVFTLGVSLAVPFVVAGFAYNLALGALSRAMPQLLVALLGVPFLIGIGLALLWLILPELFARWGAVAEGLMADPLGRLR